MIKTVKKKKATNMAITGETLKKQSEELEEHEKTRKAYKEKKKQYPIWVYFTGQDKDIPHASASKLGAFLLNEHKRNWLIIQNEDKNEFWTYKPKAITPNKSANVWQLDNIKNIKGFIHYELDKYNLWTSKAEADTYKYIVSALQMNIKSKAETVEHENDNLIPFLNGVFDVKHMKLLSNDPKYYFTDCSPYEIPETPNNDTALVNKWFDETFKENATTLKEYLGYMFFNNYAMFQAIFFLVGVGGEGKTTITNYIMSLLPASWVSNITLQALTQSEKSSTNFNIAELKGKYLNLHQDITNDFIEDSSKIKSPTGNDMINAQVKNKQEQVHFRNHAKLLFACNDMPKLSKVDKAIERRLYILNAYSISGFRKKYNEEAFYAKRGAFVLECIKACKARYKHEIEKNVKYPQFTLTPSIEKERAKWIKDNDIVKQWIDDNVMPPDQFPDGWGKDKRNRSVVSTFQSFLSWCKTSNINTKITKNDFNKRLEEHGFHKRKMHLSQNDNIFRWENFALYQDTGSIPPSNSK